MFVIRYKNWQWYYSQANGWGDSILDADVFLKKKDVNKWPVDGKICNIWDLAKCWKSLELEYSTEEILAEQAQNGQNDALDCVLYNMGYEARELNNWSPRRLTLLYDKALLAWKLFCLDQSLEGR